MTEKNDEKNGEKNIFGLIIERKTNFVALSAFILSFITLGWTSISYVIGYLRGPEITFIIPDDVILFANLCEQNKNIQFIEIIASIAYSNTGWRGHNDVLLDEKIRMKLGNNPNIQLKADDIVKIHDNNLSSKNFDCDKQSKQGNYPRITIENISSAKRIVLGAGSVVDREVHYVVDSEVCDPEWSECVKQYSGLTYARFIEKEIRNIEIEFHANFLKDGYKRARCSIILDDKMFNHFKGNYNLPTSCMDSSQS